MNEKAFDWNDLALFLAVARSAGLSPATAITGRSAATLGRRMLALERQLGAELFIRHERGYTMTQAAEQLLDDLAEVETLIKRLSHKSVSTELPMVKISAGTWTTLYLIQHLHELVPSPHDVRIRFVSTEAKLNIQRRETAIGFRSQRPTEVGLAGRKLKRVTFAAFARADAPDRWIGVRANTPSAKWTDAQIGKNKLSEVNTPRNALDMALAGHGRVVLPTFIGNTMDTLEQVGKRIDELTHYQWLVFHEQDRNLPETRRVIDRIYQLFKV